MLAAFPISGAFAQEAAAGAVKELSPVTIHRTKNPGDLQYSYFLSGWKFLLSTLPPEPRVLDARLRLSFTELSGPARDDYLPTSWAVAIVGDTLDQAIEVERGGYFVLPELEQAVREKATIMFNARTRKEYINTAWKFRIGAGQTLSYADFAKAFDEVAGVQKRIPWYKASLHDEKVARFDSLKACFHPGEGRIEIDGRPADTIKAGSCQVLKFDPALARTGRPEIAFVGPLDIVTLWDERSAGK
ncbi:hypothetical protein [Massilia sp. BKSP1R2A-1]|uniref:hypothetical protein n=1 Tax=Massilia sp. BKSP1R2A-1 TaxID=3422595 RepID=UPI003D33FB31